MSEEKYIVVKFYPGWCFVSTYKTLRGAEKAVKEHRKLNNEKKGHAAVILSVDEVRRRIPIEDVTFPETVQ